MLPLKNGMASIDLLASSGSNSATDFAERSTRLSREMRITAPPIVLIRHRCFEQCVSAEVRFENSFACDNLVYCRYSEPQSGEDGEMEVCEANKWTMLEYLVDFSFSVLPIPLAIGQRQRAGIPDSVKYEMLLAAESEMGSENEVARDFLKLLDVRARVKILVYRAREKNAWISRMENKLVTVLRGHAYPLENDTVLIAGIPSYFQWADAKKRGQPRRASCIQSVRMKQ